MKVEWQEAGGEFGTTLRWTEEPKNAWETENTEYLGDDIEGVLENRRENVGENDANVYEIRMEDENLVSIFGNTVLNDKMSKVMVGYLVKIKYLGEKKSKTGGKTYKDFQVFYKEPEAK